MLTNLPKNNYVQKVSSLSKAECYCYAQYLFNLFTKASIDEKHYRDYADTILDIALEIGAQDTLDAFLAKENNRLQEANRLGLDDEVYKVFGLPNDCSDTGLRFYRCVQYGNPDFLIRILKNVILKKTSRISSYMKDLKKVSFINTHFDFTEQELQVLLYLYRLNTWAYFKPRLNKTGIKDAAVLFQYLTGFNAQQFTTALRIDKKLRQYGFTNADGLMARELLKCIAEQNMDAFFSDLMPATPCNEAWNLSDYPIPNHVSSLMTSLLSGDAPVSLLFYGLSGTGKTEYARYIAEKLGKKILLKRASDILSRYVGDTEKNIANAFAQAAATDQILLFDECDSFFSSRENARYEWERNQVNEILTQMEEYPGILICTTNLKQILDSATKRRFDIICEFKPLEKQGIVTLLKKYFCAYKFTDAQISRIESYGTITPGDFGAVQRSVRFMAQKDISTDYIISELAARQESKDGAYAGRIGFCA